jgi:4-amino-4-deoxychorismate lyase
MLLETIALVDGVAQYIDYHQRRVTRSRGELWGIDEVVALPSYLGDAPQKGKFRCRLLYDCGGVVSVEYHPYTPKEIVTIAPIQSDIDYSYKYANRSSLEALKLQAPHDDEILIIKNGLVTDTSIANIAFHDGMQWVTPTTPLLHGTTRQRFIDEGVLVCRDIRYDEIVGYDRVALMNAMVGFKIITPQWSQLKEGTT